MGSQETQLLQGAGMGMDETASKEVLLAWGENNIQVFLCSVPFSESWEELGELRCPACRTKSENTSGQLQSSPK